MSIQNGFNREAHFISITSGRPLLYDDEREYLEHYGKWLIYAPQPQILDAAGMLIRQRLVEDPRIDCVKYTIKPALDVPNGYQRGIDYVLIVYCDDRERESVRSLLTQRLDVEEMYWKYDRDTFREMRDKGKNIPEQFRVLLDQLE